MSSREQEGGERLMREVVDEEVDGASTQQEKILEQETEKAETDGCRVSPPSEHRQFMPRPLT